VGRLHKLSDKTLTRADLVEAVVESVGLPRHEAAELVETVLQELSSTLARGEPVKLSSFGSFGIREKRQRIGRNPKTGQEVPITPRRVLVFRASNIMKKRIDETIKADLGKTKTKVKLKAKTNSRNSGKSAVGRASAKKTTSRAKTRKAAAKKPAARKARSSSKSAGK
jgi:integration host factor subunit alpha